MEAPRTLLVTKTDGTMFMVTIPTESRITFGPWSPPTKDGQYRDTRALAGTLRIYEGKTKTSEDIIAVFSDVESFRDTRLEYQERVAVEEGASMWKHDEKGYVRKERAKRVEKWIGPGEDL